MEQEQMPPPGFGPEMGPMSLDPETMQKLARGLAAIVGQIFNRPAQPQIPVAQPAPATISMPRDVAHRMLMAMYAPQKSETNRPFRIGMGVGAAINMMGVEILSEDAEHMISNLFGMMFKRRKNSPQIDITDALRRAGFGDGVHPGQAVPAVWPPNDPIAGFDSEHYYDMGGVQAAVPNRDVDGMDIPSMPDLGPQLKVEAKRRLEKLEEEDPEKAKKLGGVEGIDQIFEHFEDLFGEFFQPKASGEPESDEEPPFEPDHPQES